MEEEVTLKLNDKDHGGFYINEGDHQLGEMKISITQDELTVYHTEVDPQAEGKGFAKKLLATMVDYARRNKLKVIALCPFVNAQFTRHPKDYEDIWKH